MGEHTAELYWSCEVKLLISDPRQDYPFSIDKNPRIFFSTKLFPCPAVNVLYRMQFPWILRLLILSTCQRVTNGCNVLSYSSSNTVMINFIFLFRHLARYQEQQWNKKISSIVKECCFIFYFRELWIIAMFQLHKTKPILDKEFAMRKLIICFVMHKLAFVLQNFKE